LFVCNTHALYGRTWALHRDARQITSGETREISDTIVQVYRANDWSSAKFLHRALVNSETLPEFQGRGVGTALMEGLQT